jgi:trigger factor
MWIEVDKESSLFGVGAELEGLKKGDEKDAEVELPEEYANKEYAGKKAVMHIIIKQTKEKVLPEINDDLASKVGKKNIEEVKQEISSQLLQRKEADLAADLKNQVAQKLLKDTSFEVPATMVKRQLEVLLKQYESDLERKGVDKNTIQQNRPELEKKLEKTAREKVKLYFILDAIADKENIEIKESEVDDWLKALAGSYNKKFEEVKKYYREHDLLQGVAEELREAKTLDMLVEEAEKNIK